LLRTAASKVFGLHSASGSILWSRFIASADSSKPPPKLVSLFVSGSGGVQELNLVAQDGDTWRLITLQPFTGKLIAERAGEGKIVHVSKVPVLDAEAVGTDAMLMLVDESLTVTLHPDTPEARAAFSATLHNTYFYIVSPAQVQGYGMVPSGDGSKASAKASLRWSVQLPDSSHMSTATFPYEAAIHSPVRVKGDRNVLHKYVNRNLLALGLSVAATDESESFVQLLLLDTVSGRMLHTAQHTGSSGPVRMVLGEHWLIYTHWNANQHQHLLTTSEFYSNTSVSDDVLSLVLSGPVDYTRRENMFDSFAAPPPHVLSQSYTFAKSVTAMGTTLTRSGVTPKQVLVATAAGELVALDKRLCDPRRPLVHQSKMSTADREEGLLPYAPSLGAINPVSTISHRHQITRAKAIVTSPTMLESTSLVFTYGLDLFLTRVAPAREFDRLNEDFHYVALVGATSFLLIATIGSTWYSKRRDLVTSWR